ncbi:hypothetical protein HS067_02635 [Mannheimia haemolytica]
MEELKAAASDATQATADKAEEAKKAVAEKAAEVKVETETKVEEMKKRLKANSAFSFSVAIETR